MKSFRCSIGLHKWKEVNKHESIRQWLNDSIGISRFISPFKTGDTMQYCERCKEFEWCTDEYGISGYLGSTYHTLTKKKAIARVNEINNILDTMHMYIDDMLQSPNMEQHHIDEMIQILQEEKKFFENYEKLVKV